MMRRTIVAATVLAAASVLQVPAAAAQESYGFYVLHQRTVSLTAQYWNPILTYVSRKSGVPVELPGALIEFDTTERIFSNPASKATEDYVSGRFG